MTTADMFGCMNERAAFLASGLRHEREKAIEYLARCDFALLEHVEMSARRAAIAEQRLAIAERQRDHLNKTCENLMRLLELLPPLPVEPEIACEPLRLAEFWSYWHG